ncbi:MAG: RidA family protein [Anaerolineaceae bacterium]|jgi:2-iminobutanoate/2-iminopropanoate deaminase|nr:MAG: RidA family protein [Anaerolineaceae bacterium]
MTASKNETIATAENAPKAVGPYSLAVKSANLVFTAGQLGLDAQTGMLVEGGIEAQTEKALQNLSAVLIAAGSNISQVVKTTVFLKNMNDFSAMNEVYARFFSENPPARSAVEVAALPKGGLVEIEAIATLK